MPKVLGRSNLYAMPRTADPALEEAGLSEEIIASSIARVFGLVIGQEEVGNPAGWLAVAEKAAETLGGDSDDDVQIFLPRFSDVLRAAYGLAVDQDYQPVPAESLTEEVRLGWQAVTRLIVQLFAMDSQEARGLGKHEQAMAAFVRSRSATPK